MATTLTSIGIVTIIVLQLVELGGIFFNNLKKSECCHAKIEMKDSSDGKGHHNKTIIKEVHNHYSNDNSIANSKEEKSDDSES
jgi:hypothetical protein